MSTADGGTAGPWTVLDQERLSEVTGGDREFERELLGEFLHSTPEMLKRILAAARGSDPDVLRKAAHAVKGSSLTIGGDELGHLCHEVERLSVPESFAEATARAAELPSAFQRLEQALRLAMARAA
ncbi:MAG TPA: Hpt domain-containing protein [Candidatus Saccharimonadaceae bacterium]|jgi:HPt (histidine-containing phosphotransfer) domain-containing protein|nr:Hpt domain-containing protein [Candidatus Saccharimonadaceae bacterium]